MDLDRVAKFLTRGDTDGDADGDDEVALHGVPADTRARLQDQRALLRAVVRGDGLSVDAQALARRVASHWDRPVTEGDFCREPVLGQVLALGAHVGLTVDAMGRAAASATPTTLGAAVSAGSLLMVLVGSLGGAQGGGDAAIQQLVQYMQACFQALGAQLRELQDTVDRNHAHTMHQFRVVRADMAALGMGLRHLGDTTRTGLLQLRQALGSNLRDVTDTVLDAARATAHSLQELHFEDLCRVHSLVTEYDARGGLSRDEVLQCCASLERWLRQPPANRLHTGEAFACAPKTSSVASVCAYIAGATPAGLLLVAAHAAKKHGLGISLDCLDAAPFVNLDLFSRVVPTYAQAVQHARRHGVVYDPEGALWAQCVNQPLAACEALLRALKPWEAALLDVLQQAADAAWKAGFDVARDARHALASDVAARAETIVLERAREAVMDLRTPVAWYTRDTPHDGGWCTVNATFAARWVMDVAQQEIDAAHVPGPVVLPRPSAGARPFTLRGRFAQVDGGPGLLQPTHLHLGSEPVTAAICAGLAAEASGLGFLRVRATLAGRVEHHFGEMACWAPPAPVGLYYQGSLNSDAAMAPLVVLVTFAFEPTGAPGPRTVLQQTWYELPPCASTEVPCSLAYAGSDRKGGYAWVWGGEPTWFPPFAWSGDSLKATLLSRWKRRRAVDASFLDGLRPDAAVFDSAKQPVSRWVNPVCEAVSPAAVEALRARADGQDRERDLQALDPAVMCPRQHDIFKTHMNILQHTTVLIHALVDSPRRQPDVFDCMTSPSRPRTAFTASTLCARYQTQLELVQTHCTLHRARVLAVPVAHVHLPTLAALTEEVADLRARLAKRDRDMERLLKVVATLTAQLASLT